MDAFAGAIGVSDSDGKSTPVYAVCEPYEAADPYYYAHIVREMARTQYILALARGIRERSTDFRFDTFANQPLPVPPLSEQKTIAAFLAQQDRSIQRLIRIKRRLITLLTEQKQAIIHRAVTRGLDPNVPLKPSGVAWLGDVPESWGVRRLKSLSLVKRGASPRPIDDPRYFSDDGEHSWVRISDVTASSRYLERTTQRLSKLGASLSVQLKPGDIFLSIAGSVGKPIITKIVCCIHDGFVYFPTFKGNREFLYYVFASGRPYGGLGKLGTQLNLNTETVGNIVIGWPPIEEQYQIVAYLDETLKNIDNLVERAQREINLIREYRTRLIADVVTGKLDVRGVALPSLDDAPHELSLDDTEAAEETEIGDVELEAVET